MGRACMELWTNVHYVLKVIALVLLIVVEFLVLDWSINRFSRQIHVEGYYLASVSFLVIVLYGYTWFDSTVILEICITILTIFMLLLSVILFFHEHYDRTFVSEVYDKSVYTCGRDKFTVFVAVTIVGIIILIVDLILLLLKAVGKTSSGSSRNTGRQRRQAQRQVEENE